MIPDIRLRYLAGALHELGPRPIFEFLKEVENGADLRKSLEAYARIAPRAAFIADNGGRDLPKMRRVQ